MFAYRAAVPIALLLIAPAKAEVVDRSAAIIAELNRARTDPAGYARDLEAFRRLYDGKIVRDPGERLPRITREGTKAVDEAIAFLRRQTPLAALGVDATLARAAADHVRDQGPAGLMGHGGSDQSNPLQRVIRRGLKPALVGENISFGPSDPRAIVRELIVDDGVADRGHRANIFNPGFGRAGASCGPHRTYSLMCVIDFASTAERRGLFGTR